MEYTKNNSSKMQATLKAVELYEAIFPPISILKSFMENTRRYASNKQRQ